MRTTDQNYSQSTTHDRSARAAPAEDAFAGQTMLSSKDDAGDDLMDISAGQKMLSAISGSLFTSLLSECLFTRRRSLECDCEINVARN
jgi:hypothetical protein